MRSLGLFPVLDRGVQPRGLRGKWGRGSSVPDGWTGVGTRKGRLFTDEYESFRRRYSPQTWIRPDPVGSQEETPLQSP